VIVRYGCGVVVRLGGWQVTAVRWRFGWRRRFRVAAQVRLISEARAAEVQVRVAADSEIRAVEDRSEVVAADCS